MSSSPSESLTNSARIVFARSQIPAFIKLGSNHHMEIFTNGKEGKERKLQGRVVTMLEAAERKSKKRSIINKEPNPEWGEGYSFLMSLAVNDMVLWNKDDDKVKAHRDMGDSPIYRGSKDIRGRYIFSPSQHLHYRR